MNQREWSARLHVPTVGAMALIVAVWSLASWRYGAYVLPSPLSVVRGFVDIVASGEVWTHTGASLSRIFVGFGGAVAGACPLGVEDTDRKSTRLNSSHGYISDAGFFLEKKKKT